MLHRNVALTLLLLATSSARAQFALNDGLPPLREETAPLRPTTAESAWLDLRQARAKHARVQSAPRWVEAVNLVPGVAADGSARTTFRIRVAHPAGDYRVLFFRLFFEDVAGAQPELVAWDESGSQVLRSGVLGSGVGLASSESQMIPMNGVSVIDVEVPGDGSTIRGAFLDWMTSREVVQPLSAAQRDIIPDPFSNISPLHVPEKDEEQFGTVSATLAAETIAIGREYQEGAAFQFPLELDPLVALLTFEVASPRIDSPPEIYVNGEGIGPANLSLPELADPGYRGEIEGMSNKGMQFHYTGWIRAQKLIPSANLKTGTNDVVVVGGAAGSKSAIRGTQIQLKYLWDKSDYLLRTNP